MDHIAASTGSEPLDEDIERLSRLGSDHITLTGRYRVLLPAPLQDRSAYRSLNAPGDAASRLARFSEQLPGTLAVDVVLRSQARPQRIREQYDDLLRTAASLKRGWVPASLLITRLKNATPQTPLGAALGEYGRIVRTNFLLVYCADPAMRARIAGQLNEGETLHALRRHLVIGSRAQIPADEDDHCRHALCLQLLVNAVQVWNARYMTASIEHLHTTQPDVVADEDALARIAPVTHAHVSSLGRYELNRQPPPSGQLRPLRRGDDETEPAVPTPPFGVSGDKH